MTTDNILWAMVVAGLVMCGVYVRAEFRAHRARGQRERERHAAQRTMWLSKGPS